MPPYALLGCAFAVILGTLAVTATSPDLRLVVVLAALAGVAFAVRGEGEPPRFRALLLGALAVGALDAGLRAHAGAPMVEQRTARYAGTILERAPENDGSWELRIALDARPTVTVRVRGSVPQPGTRIVIRGRLEPFDDARNPGEPSEREIERDRGLDGRLDAATILSSGNASMSPRIVLARAHEWAHEQLRERLGEPSASVVAGELWGERSALPPALRTEFQETGTVHVLVTAGLHLGAVAALCALTLGCFSPPRPLTCLLTIAVLWTFVWWSGAQLPAERAATMATLALCARAAGRPTFSWNALACAAIVVALLRPQSVATASFALSFSCVGSIFACAGPVERWIEERVNLPDRIREALVLSIATQLGTWPLGAAVFLQFSPYAIAANFAIVPCVAVTMALGAAQLVTAWCAPLAEGFAHLNSWLLAWILAVVQTIAELPSSTIPMTPAPAWCIGLYDAALLATPVLLRRGARTPAACALLLGAIWILWPPQSLDGRLRITVLDVGQADGIVVQTPRGHTLLVDAGGRLERVVRGEDSVAEQVGERIVVPFLLRNGIHDVDVLFISHPHGDHAGGAAPVLRRLRVGALADSGQRYSGHAYQDAVLTARTQGVALAYPRAGATWSTDDGVTLHFIGPSLPFIGGTNAINSNSIAFVLQYRAFRMLFTGDAGSESEQRFLSQHIDLHADVLKVGHHGSAYGSTPEFIRAVSPRFAVISVGRHNLFGHPASSTLRTLEEAGAQIYRTDEDGAITIVSDGKGETVSRFLQIHE